MYLKKIIAQGFKSFADNTIIDLENNIAGIVGPNGSGKSNVVDAVRWVLGEQSVKSLRGDGNMTDVIFSGSKSRNPMNVASVTLIFDNSDHYLNISFDEVSIKRRLYRDGTNEYYLNNEKCRLKDITDILLDSGIAKESFNIISQGKIEEILSNKPNDRRVIFEEAAGVLKYKKRKEEALRKLDKTHDNINRVNDIINELEVQVEPLREQKIKALTYIDLNDELKDLEISLIANDITNINDKYQAHKNEIEVLNDEIMNITTTNSTNEAKIEEYKLKLSNIDNNIKEKQNKLLDITSKVEKINSKKQIILERKKYEVDNTKLHNNIVELKETELKLKNEIDTHKKEITLRNNELNSVNKHIDIIETDIIKFKDKKSNLDQQLRLSIRNSSILSSKIDALNESINSNNLLPYSVKNVLNNPKLRGIHNIIGNLFEVEEKYSTAISIVLSSSSNNVVVDDEICAKEAINYLKNSNIGRVTFFPINLIKEKNIDTATLNIIKNESGFIDIASNLVKYDSKYTNIIKNQLGNVIVVENLNNANNISKRINHKYRVVTLDGELLHVGGSLTGGTIKTKNVITEKYELDRLIKALENNNNKTKEIENLINENDYQLKALEDDLYLQNKEKLNLEEIINLKNSTIKELNIKFEEINDQINGTDNLINNELSKEEDEILKEYYGAVKEKEELITNLDILNNKRTNLNDKLEEEQYSVKKENQVFNQKNNELKSLEIEVNRMDVKLDNLLSILNETYSMTYEQATSLYKLEIDESIARNKVNSLKKKIKDLGPVNLTAPEEYEKVSERYEFLISQREDLSKAENTLLEIIEEMDSVMKQEFMKTFKIIQENFTKTFRELFKGGNAELVLTDNSNILETGIEIIASPPGKSLKSISLLSGGEKTFTAISLLFAILKSRPVPFCILDEVEAALDDVNVDAFGEYITKLKEKTQFIVITHKKKTMEYVDILYGITMQESGVSKLVSVKLEDLDAKK